MKIVGHGFMKPVSIIVAVDQSGGFGKDGKIPWANEPFAKEDFKHFQNTTKGGVCIMGRRTYEDMAEMMLQKKKKIGKNILPNRESYVLTSKSDAKFDGAQTGTGLRSVVESIKELDDREIFILGGDKLFTQSLVWTNKIYMTIVKEHYDCDRFFGVDYVHNHFKINSGKETDKLYFIEYVRIKQ